MLALATQVGPESAESAGFVAQFFHNLWTSTQAIKPQGLADASLLLSFFGCIR
jgi:hypothetical protein